ncbi:hypothetical protein [Massilia sp. CF038]|uniref:hypothetical protein n=1 Tax=Massilia sp. CF038 TaxID=1881045 RepID=UPI00091237D2|nr:hypothetical protein [Massilia sp. CF038]SHG99102.1 hypothetical protein SAMN05428948_2214 [Massilia sp. CF038]
MSARLDTALCRTTLAGGVVATVTATRRPRAGRADVKCTVGADPVLAERMQQVVRLARHTEAQLDSRDQVVLSIDPVPARHERDWELAAVLADRLVRGVWQAPGPVLANGWSTQWHSGRIDSHDLAPAGTLLGGELGWLGSLNGQPDVSASVATARAWFPLHSGGINDSLCWVEVSVYPLQHAGGEEEDSIATPGLDLTRQAAVRLALCAARHFDGRALGRWRTVVRFGQPQFQGNSFELALVMADRLARGRDYVPRGRIIASGCSSAWHAGRVDTVEGGAPKCALIAREAVAGDRILLPLAWEAALTAEFVAGLRARGASLACIDRIGMI